MHFSAIVACDSQNGIGQSGKIPWECPSDMKYFKRLTTHCTDKSKKNDILNQIKP